MEEDNKAFFEIAPHISLDELLTRWSEQVVEKSKASAIGIDFKEFIGKLEILLTHPYPLYREMSRVGRLSHTNLLSNACVNLTNSYMTAMRELCSAVDADKDLYLVLSNIPSNVVPIVVRNAFSDQPSLNKLLKSFGRDMSFDTYATHIHRIRKINFVDKYFGKNNPNKGLWELLVAYSLHVNPHANLFNDLDESQLEMFFNRKPIIHSVLGESAHTHGGVVKGKLDIHIDLPISDESDFGADNIQMTRATAHSILTSNREHDVTCDSVEFISDIFREAAKTAEDEVRISEIVGYEVVLTHHYEDQDFNFGHFLPYRMTLNIISYEPILGMEANIERVAGLNILEDSAYTGTKVSEYIDKQERAFDAHLENIVSGMLGRELPNAIDHNGDVVNRRNGAVANGEIVYEDKRLDTVLANATTLAESISSPSVKVSEF